MATYEIDASHSQAEFGVKHLVSTVKGRFQKIGGSIEFDESDPTGAQVVARAEVTSINTGDSRRDDHLRTSDFFDAEHYPELVFRSKRVEMNGHQNQYKVVGDLTIRGVTKEVAMDAEFTGKGADPWGGERVGFSAATTVNRKDFDLHWNAPLEAGGFLVGDNVRISIDGDGVRKN